MTKRQEIIGAIKQEICQKTYAASGKLPSERELCERFAASRGTVRAALDDLCRAGLIERRNGLGSYLTERGRRKNSTIGLLIPDYEYFTFFAALKNELSRLSENAGYSLRISTWAEGSGRKSAAQLRRMARTLAVARVEGVIFRPCLDPKLADANREAARIFRNAQTPLVLLDADIAEAPDRSDCDIVSVNNVNAARQLARHLLARGRRRFAFVTDAKLSHRNGNWSARLFGLAGELALGGIDEGVRTLTLDPRDRAAVRRTLGGKSRPDAIVCGNDEIAVALIETLAALGLRVPDDISVAGFDDLPCASASAPPLTTVRQPTRQIAAAALKAIFQRIRQPTGAPREICLPTPLVVRQST